MPFTPIELSIEKLFGIINLAEDGIISVNRKQEIVLFNRGAEKIFGFRASEVLGRNLDLLIPTRYRQEHPARIEQFRISGVVSRPMAERRPIQALRKDGTEFPAEISISRLDVVGEPIYTAIVRDCTDRMRYEGAILAMNQELEARVAERTAELEATNQRLLHQNDEIEMFVYSVSHDLRSPLVNLEGFSKELNLTRNDLKKKLSEIATLSEAQQTSLERLDTEMSESIYFIQNSVTRLTRIIDALLRLSRVGRVMYQPQSIDLHALVVRVVNSFQMTIAEKNAVVEVLELPRVWGDSTAIEQVVSNLLSNALNYLSPERSGQITIGQEGIDATGWPICFIRDNGVGIRDTHAKQLFQIFRRMRPELAPGEGIGLAIVRRVIERHFGRIWAESQEGIGSRFFFTLPPDGPAQSRPHLTT